MSVLAGQPLIRFNTAGPMSLQGASYVPKLVMVEKTITTAEGYEDFWTVPAGTWISDVFVYMATGTGNTTTQIALGSTTNTVALMATNSMSAETSNNSFHSSTGLFFGTSGALRLSIAGTAAAGVVRMGIEYFELASMATDGKHFSL